MFPQRLPQLMCCHQDDLKASHREWALQRRTGIDRWLHCSYSSVLSSLSSTLCVTYRLRHRCSLIVVVYCSECIFRLPSPSSLTWPNIEIQIGLCSTIEFSLLTDSNGSIRLKMVSLESMLRKRPSKRLLSMNNIVDRQCDDQILSKQKRRLHRPPSDAGGSTEFPPSALVAASEQPAIPVAAMSLLQRDHRLNPHCPNSRKETPSWLWKASPSVPSRFSSSRSAEQRCGLGKPPITNW